MLSQDQDPLLVDTLAALLPDSGYFRKNGFDPDQIIVPEKQERSGFPIRPPAFWAGAGGEAAIDGRMGAIYLCTIPHGRAGRTVIVLISVLHPIRWSHNV
jgi:hypothetical protein